MRFGSALILGFALVHTASANLLPPNYNDAPLHAVQFVDAREGWAVGDHGIIWHTVDSGRTWERQKSGTKSSLRSICFLTPYTGWIAGRTELPNGAGSSGILLFTADGGATWAEKSSGTLPGINFVKFFDENSGVVVGDGSDSQPAGIFFTADGGKRWIPGMGPRATSYLAAHFPTQTSGTVGGIWSKLATVREGKATAAEIDTLKGRSIRGIASNGSAVLAVADGGTILTSVQGTKWAVANTGLPSEAAGCLDFRAVASHGETVWAMGRPGSVVLRSPDFGKTWERFHTGWNTPINALYAIGANDLVAVGDLGTILMSEDAGKTWKARKCGGQAAGVLFAHAHSQQLPADAMALVGQRDGYFAVATGMTIPEPSTADAKRSLDAFRLNAAVREVGGVAADHAWAFPIPEYLRDSKADQLLQHWNTQHGNRAEAELVRQLVLAYRMWKPDVIVSDRLTAEAGPAEQLVLKAAREAFKLAGDPKACPEQLEILGLTVHSPKKLYAVGPESGAECAVTIDTTEFAKYLFDTPQAFSEPAFALLGEGAIGGKRRCFRLVSHRMPGAESHAELMQGIDLPQGGIARRVLPVFSEAATALFAGREQDTRTRQTLEGIALTALPQAGADKSLALIGQKLKQLPDDIACRTGIALGRELALRGQWIQAREMYLLVLTNYSQYPESVDAIRWLAKYYASGEARRRAENANSIRIEKSTAGVQQAGYLETVGEREQYRMSDPEAVKIWCKACLELEPKLAGFGPVYSDDPSIQLSTLSARRQLGLTGDAAKQLQSYFRNAPGTTEMAPGTDLWRDCLAAEMWLMNPAAIRVQPKPVAACPATTIKPFLDGKLDDDCWRQYQPLDLKAQSNAGSLKGYTTKTYLAHDADFIYIAVECQHPEGKQVAKATKRNRDEDLKGFDRVDILLDLDRDYQSHYRLQIDQRGCVSDDCNGDTTWNPKWFVAVESTPTGWTAELAIPRTELTGNRIGSGTVWAANVSRVIPGVGVQTWSGPPDAKVRPEGMGLLKFVDLRK